MARIELRDAIIRIKDGLSGTADINDAGVGAGNTDFDINTVALNTDDTELVPVGARFTISTETGAPVVHTVTARTPASMSPTTNIQFTPALAAEVDEVQSIAIYVGTVSGGDFTLTISLYGESPFTTAAIAYDAVAATIEAAIDTAAGIAAIPGFVAGDIAVTGGPLTTTPVVLTFSGTSVDGANHGLTTIDGTGLTGGGSAGAITTTTNGSGVQNGDSLTFISQQIEVKVGDGNITWTVNREFEYLLDRGDLDTVREGDQVPLDVTLDMVYEFITTGTDNIITPYDALNGIGGADEWVSSSSDACEPYAVDIEIEHDPPCGSEETETTTLTDFRYDTLEADLSAATVVATGRCNTVLPTVVRS